MAADAGSAVEHEGVANTRLALTGTRSGETAVDRARTGYLMATAVAHGKSGHLAARVWVATVWAALRLVRLGEGGQLVKGTVAGFAKIFV